MGVESTYTDKATGEIRPLKRSRIRLGESSSSGVLSPPVSDPLPLIGGFFFVLYIYFSTCVFLSLSTTPLSLSSPFEPRR